MPKLRYVNADFCLRADNTLNIKMQPSANAANILKKPANKIWKKLKSFSTN